MAAEHEVIAVTEEIARDRPHRDVDPLALPPLRSLIETVRTEDAEVILVGLANIATRARRAADALREQGEGVGVIKVSTLRPFPATGCNPAAP